MGLSPFDFLTQSLVILAEPLSQIFCHLAEVSFGRQVVAGDLQIVLCGPQFRAQNLDFLRVIDWTPGHRDNPNGLAQRASMTGPATTDTRTTAPVAANMAASVIGKQHTYGSRKCRERVYSRPQSTENSGCRR